MCLPRLFLIRLALLHVVGLCLANHTHTLPLHNDVPMFASKILSFRRDSVGLHVLGLPGAMKNSLTENLACLGSNETTIALEGLFHRH